ncbi:right-handed parallel beta-helix repeat-containing protein [Streptomyces sp. NBC_01549]|uniref:right-handed parallel beta-helix repeat-containing protein n=1 Tax=Streptomyces sp. NBC_01549 TaxID=2975874 RepID=UPI00224EBFE8|nr:right-handed parallel beta-helix repeat-containing protein [Streptomyces sp. NBC_01549]MCX4596102.1 right-handed parallel beta-helix repeat-containing protein [Streptomyces sp. NBC_01549]
MTFPTGATTITVTINRPVPAGGAGNSGRIIFTPSTVLVDATHKAIYSGSGPATLDTNGAASIDLLTTDAPGVLPTGWRWHVDEQLPGARRTYYIGLPSTLGATIDLSALSPISAPDSRGQSIPPSGPAGGALAGTYPNPQLSTATIASFDAAGAASAALASAVVYADGKLAKTANLSDLGSANTARTNLGLGNAATRNIGTTTGTVAAGDDARITGALQTGTAAGGDLGGTLPNPQVVTTHLAAPLPVAQGGTGSATQPFVDLTADQTVAGNKTFSYYTTLQTGQVNGPFNLLGTVGFYGAAATGQQTIAGSRSDGTALASLLAALNLQGLVADTSTAGPGTMTVLGGTTQLTPTGNPTTDAAAINTAILTVSQRGGGRVLLSGDTWTVSSSITPRSNVTLAGVPGTVITHTGNSNIIYGSTITFTDFTLEGITFLGPVNEFPAAPKRARTTSGAGAQTAVFLSGDLDTTGSGQAQLTNFTMRNCAVRNMSALPIRIGGVRGKVSVTGCEFTNNQDCGFLFCQEVIYNGNHVMQGADNGVSLSRGCQKITCTGNTIENVAYNGIWVAGFGTDKGPTSFAVTGNVVKNVGLNGVYIDYAAKHGAVVGNEIDCGLFRGPSDQPSDANGAGVYIGGFPTTDRANPTDWATGITVVGNHIRQAARAGVYLNGARRVQVTGNVIVDIGTQFLADGTTAISSADATQNVGILMENASTSANVTVALNDVIDSRGTAYCNFGLVPQNTAGINAYLNTMIGTRQASNLLETGPARTWQSTQIFNQDIKATAGVTSGSNAGSGTIEGARVNGASGSVRAFVWQTAGVKRWYMRANGTAEGGSNAGSDWELNSYDDSGNLLATPIRVTRSSGQVAVNGTLAQNAHRVSGASAATIAAGAQSASATAASNGANDSSGTVNTTAVASPAAGTIATVTYASAYAAVPKVTLTPRNAATASAGLYATAEGTGGFSVATANAPGASASLSFTYHVEG